MKSETKLNNLRIAPRKVRLIADLIRGLDVQEALNQLAYTVRRSSLPMEKLLRSAIANAENNFGLDRDNLYVSAVLVGEGATLKRWLPRAFGRATMLKKRTSKISLVLEERVEGKNRKTKEQLETERKNREEAKKKLEQELKDEQAKESPSSIDKVSSKKESHKEDRQGGKKGWIKKVFQRKSV